jgi:hypothetical protein
MWYNLAGANGQELALKNRDNIAKVMTAEQIAVAQKRASACLANNYKNC